MLPDSNTPADAAEASAADYSVVTPAAPTPEGKRPRLRLNWRLIKDILEVLFLVLTIYTGVNLATARAIVEGRSMEPNFATGQLVIVNRFAYFFSKPQRGDVIVLHNPAERCKDVVKNRSLISLPFVNQDNSVGCEDLIKRVMGLPGETMQIINGKVIINGTVLDEPYLSEENLCPSGCDRSFQLGPDEYLVLGDNRRNSYDGHSFGPIKGELIVGQAWVRYWPLDEAKVIPHPDYGTISQTPIPLPTNTVTPTPGPTALPSNYGSPSMGSFKVTLQPSPGH